MGYSLSVTKDDLRVRFDESLSVVGDRLCPIGNTQERERQAIEPDVAFRADRAIASISAHAPLVLCWTTAARAWQSLHANLGVGAASSHVIRQQ